LKWADAPHFGKDVQTAVVAGDPSKEGPYVMRIKFPRWCRRTRTRAENITVISGTFGVGMCMQADKSKGQKLPAGSFFRIDPQTPHFCLGGKRRHRAGKRNGTSIKMVEPQK